MSSTKPGGAAFSRSARSLAAVVLLALAGFALFTILSAGAASAQNYTVDDSYASDNVSARQYMTIQGAINAAAAGDNITVMTGVYAEQATVNKSVWINGSARNNTFVTPSGGYGFTVTVNNVTISNLTVNYTYGGIWSNGGGLNNLAIANMTFE